MGVIFAKIEITDKFVMFVCMSYRYTGNLDISLYAGMHNGCWGLLSENAGQDIDGQEA